MIRVVKLMDSLNMTFMGTVWDVGVTHKVVWGGKMCTEGCLHAYRDVETALFGRYLHCPRYEKALICETPEVKLDDGVKIGVAELTGIEWTEFRDLEVEEVVEFASMIYIYSHDGSDYQVQEMIKEVTGEAEFKSSTCVYKRRLKDFCRGKGHPIYRPYASQVIGAAWRECNYNERPELFSQVARKVISGKEIEKIDKNLLLGRLRKRVSISRRYK